MWSKNEKLLQNCLLFYFVAGEKNRYQFVAFNGVEGGAGSGRGNGVGREDSVADTKQNPFQ